MKQIIAMGGGGFSMEPDNPLLDEYILAQSDADEPKICFLAQASGDSANYIEQFYRAFNQRHCRPAHLSLFSPHTADIESFLLGQDIIYVGGGNTKSMMALWREWGMDVILRKALEAEVVLAGISAGSICWFEYGTTDSIPGGLTALPCLGLLTGSCSPHYDGQTERRPKFRALIANGDIPAGYAFDDSAAGHFIDGKLRHVISSVPTAHGYYVEKVGDSFRETQLETRYLGEG